MSRNEPAAYGRDVRSLNDADALFSEVEGIDVTVQDALHRLTVDNILGGEGVIVGWGFDVRRLIGMTRGELASHQPILNEVLLRDDRIESATITLEQTQNDGLDDVQIDISCTTALGPFSLTRNVSAITDDVGQS